MIPINDTEIVFRPAITTDIKSLIEMLADDQLGTKRETVSDPIDPAYQRAFNSINTDPNNELVVVEANDKIIGMLQLTFIPYLSHKGAWRCLIEAVRIKKEFRGQGIGSFVFKWAIREAEKKKCFMVQLTSNKERTDAIRFYQNLGFKASHEGFKLILGDD